MPRTQASSSRSCTSTTSIRCILCVCVVGEGAPSASDIVGRRDRRRRPVSRPLRSVRRRAARPLPPVLPLWAGARWPLCTVCILPCVVRPLPCCIGSKWGRDGVSQAPTGSKMRPPMHDLLLRKGGSANCGRRLGLAVYMCTCELQIHKPHCITRACDCCMNCGYTWACPSLGCVQTQLTPSPARISYRRLGLSNVSPRRSALAFFCTPHHGMES